MDTTHDAPTCQFKPLLKRKGLAIALDCSLRTIDNLQASGMPCVFIGRSRRFIAEEVIAWLKRKGGAR
jgi:phage terminase Nu1 subunit (DNA packaging protein)